MGRSVDDFTFFQITHKKSSTFFIVSFTSEKLKFVIFCLLFFRIFFLVVFEHIKSSCDHRNFDKCFVLISPCCLNGLNEWLFFRNFYYFTFIQCDEKKKFLIPKVHHMNEEKKSVESGDVRRANVECHCEDQKLVSLFFSISNHKVKRETNFLYV